MILGIYMIHSLAYTNTMASSSFASNETDFESTAVPNWVELPRDITANIFQRLGTIDIVTSVRYVCPIWWNIFKDPLMWRTIRMTKFSDFYDQPVEICQYAIKQSCGHLENIFIDDFATDDLLKFIAENASNLRGLRLVNCPGISNEVFCQAVKILPLLERLNISLCNLSKDSLEVVGQYCPLLTVLIFGRSEFPFDICDDDAIVIAETMVGLRHLNIQGSSLSNAGLFAILAGCPHLEFLDIRGCYNLDLNDSLKKKCIDQIKNLRLPEPIVYDDYDNIYVYTVWDLTMDDDCYDPND
ncbi:putative F-box/LRR-repeat protein 23 [Vicia villosa]|uniref:putative F-box/LRR-repeat protein 23 n=1 Tax=Vicia villosa TaxID=3911 RepID=UPI00273C3758|nr:putative F-box/LRR-repeat protein 23 [Vicia villosa]